MWTDFVRQPTEPWVSRERGGQPFSKQSPSTRQQPIGLRSLRQANPVPLALGNKTGGCVRKRDSPRRGQSLCCTGSIYKVSRFTGDALVVPAWMAKELDSPDVATRLRALDTWAQSAPPGSVDPLILAYEDKDERVRARAMELIEQDWARTADAEQSDGGTEDSKRDSRVRAILGHLGNNRKVIH